jgi:type I restriction enzyme, S subunit
MIPAGNVMLSFKLSIGKVGINRIDAYTNEAIAALLIKDRSRLNTRYLYWVLKRTNWGALSNNAAKGKTLNRKSIEELEIPLPSLQSQSAIARSFDLADRIHKLRRNSLLDCDQLSRAAFLLFFDEKPAGNRKWPKLPLRQLGKLMTGNTPSRSEKSNFSESGVEWIKTENLRTDSIYPTTSSEFLSERGQKRARIAEANTLLIACTAGSLKAIGRVALLDRVAAFNQQIIALVPSRPIAPLFLYFSMREAQPRLRAVATTGMIKSINQRELGNIEITLPPYDKQLEFESFVRPILHQRSLYEKQLDDIAALIDATERWAFSDGLSIAGQPSSDIDPAIDSLPGTFDRGPESNSTQSSAGVRRASHTTDGAGDSMDKVIEDVSSPFGYRELWEHLNATLPEVDYEVLKDALYAQLQAGHLVQDFDMIRKEIIFKRRGM